MAAHLIAEGIAISKPIIQKYSRKLIKRAKPLVEKSLQKYKLKNRNFKGASGAPDKVKKKLVKIDKSDILISKMKKELFGDREYKFVVAFNSRNAHRKHPANLIMAFKSFCTSLSKEESDTCALIMHTDKICEAGTDLIKTTEAVCPEYKVVLHEDRKSPEEMTAFYNIADVTINVPSKDTQRIQESHIMIGQIICSLLEKDLLK